MCSIIRQLEEKNVANEMDILLWSDRMDLVAFSNLKGEVALHRLTWTRAWSLAPILEGNLVKAMAWRPDGKALAIGYNCGKIVLVSVEDKSTLHTINLTGTITCICWAQEKMQSNNKDDPNELNKYTKFIDYSATFLPEPPDLSNYNANGHDNIKGADFFQNQSDLNLLAIGTSNGLIYISIFGCFPCTIIDVNKIVGSNCSILSIYLSENLSETYVTIKDAESCVKVVILNTKIFETHSKELFCVALKHQQITSLISYLQFTITTIKETWESILLEMDAKLSKYASKTPPGTLSADFLDLLMFGIASDEMQEFLLQDLTKKGLEKFGQTIEMSYANIQKLLLKNVTKVAQNITYHLAKLRGMARMEHQYKVLGLREDQITEAISANGSFLIKSGEMQQIINTSMLNYKAFFRWLYTAIIHLMYETVPPEIPKMTQQDLAYIAEFLQNFDDIDEIVDLNDTTSTEKHGFIMERVGQYLADTELTIPPNMELNEWDSFLMNHNCIKNHPCVIKHYKEMSLVQQFNHFQSSFQDIFNDSQLLIANQCVSNKIINCAKIDENCIKFTHINSNANALLYVFLLTPNDGFYFVEITQEMDNYVGKAAFIYISQKDQDSDKYLINDVKFYTENVLSLLLQDNATRFGILFQCPTTMLREKMQVIDLCVDVCKQDVVRLDANDFAQISLRHVPMVASQFAVSGSRRVSIVLSENRRKVMLFEMEGEEEEEEDGDVTNSTVRGSDASMQEQSDAE